MESFEIFILHCLVVDIHVAIVVVSQQHNATGVVAGYSRDSSDHTLGTVQ